MVWTTFSDGNVASGSTKHVEWHVLLGKITMTMNLKNTHLQATL